MKKSKINGSEFACRLGAYSHGYKVEINDMDLDNRHQHFRYAGALRQL